MSDQSIVTVLGVGASERCGYPLAKDLFPKLKQFGNTLGEDCKLVRVAIDHVISQAKDLDCLTPDDLALQAHQHRTGGEHNYRAALRTLAYARIATDLFFLFTDNWFGGFPSYGERALIFRLVRESSQVFCELIDSSGFNSPNKKVRRMS